MIVQEILSHQSNKLDSVLVQLCDMIVQEHSRDPDPAGGRMVAATVYDPKGQTSMIISNQRENGSWNHAERNAIDQYIKDFGSIPNGSIIVTTLSPCGERLDSRYGESCVDLINDHPEIKLAYCGYDDRTQSMDQANFEVTITANSKIKELCKEFADRVTDINENFADSRVKGKSRPGRVKRAGASCAGSVTDLRAKAKNTSGERAKMYHWCANMKSGKKK